MAARIAELETQEQQVLALYYQEEVTMREVGEVIGVGESRVSQIHSTALVKLRARLRRRVEEDAAARAQEAGAGKERT